jgi:hypothetical protein
MAIESNVRTSRRSLLTTVAAALGGAVAASVSGAQRVLAAGDDGNPIVVGGQYQDARHATGLWNLTAFGVAVDLATDDGDGLRAGANSGTGVTASATSGHGVFATSTTGEGVFGKSQQGTGVHGVASYEQWNNGYPAAVLGEAKLPKGVSILGNNYATSGIAIGVQGSSYSPTGQAVIGWANEGGTGVVGVSSTTYPTNVPQHTGLVGVGADRGAVVQGGKAQLRLIPSSAVSHPATGLAGDLFMDSSHRLWVCKGGAAWRQIA